MAKRKFSRLLFGDRGAVLPEFALVVPLMLIVIGVGIDFFRIFYEWNAAAKAVERGARIAAVSDPAVAGLLAKNAVGTANLPGDTYRSTPSYDPVVAPMSCSGNTCVGTTLTDMVYGRGKTACGAAAGPYAIGMCHLYSRITPANVVITYSVRSHLGYYGRPSGPVVDVTVSLTGLRLTLSFLRLIPGLSDQLNFFPSATTSIVSEDLSSVAP